MRRLLLTLLVVLSVCSYLQADEVIFAKKKAAAANYCTACPDATGGADVLCEVPDGTADGLCGWTVVESGGATGDVNMAATPDNSPSLGCTDIPMTYVMSFTKTNTNAGSLYAYKGCSATANYIQFYVKFTAEGLANTEEFAVFALAQNASSPGILYRSAYWALYQDNSGNLKMFLTYHQAAGWSNGVDSISSTLSLDTWYGVRIKFLDPSGGGSDNIQWWMDYSNNGSWTEVTNNTGLTLDRPIENAFFGVGDPQSGGSKTQTYYVTGLKIDDDTMPTACTR
jgi:hypothetical protein